MPSRTLITEDYIEVIAWDPKFVSGKKDLLAAWKGWKDGPETKSGDVGPAAKEFIKHVTNWMKKNIK